MLHQYHKIDQNKFENKNIQIISCIGTQYHSFIKQIINLCNSNQQTQPKLTTKFILFASKNTYQTFFLYLKPEPNPFNNEYYVKHI